MSLEGLSDLPLLELGSRSLLFPRPGGKSKDSLIQSRIQNMRMIPGSPEACHLCAFSGNTRFLGERKGNGTPGDESAECRWRADHPQIKKMRGVSRSPAPPR